MKKTGIISIFLAILVIACTLTAIIPISAESSISRESWIKGDADGDGTITIIDATIIQRKLANYTVNDPERVDECGDINGNGLDILDATLIQRYLANYTVPYEINVPIELPTEQPTEQPTAAITEPSFIVDTVNAEAGDQNVAVNVTVKNNPGVAAIALDVIYADDKLELTGFTYNTAALSGASTTPYNASARIPCLFMVNGTANVTGDFVFATLYFNVKSGAVGSCPITLTYDEDNVYDIGEDNIAFDVISGGITLSAATEPAQPGSHTVVFKDYDGKVLSTQTVKDGEAATAPANPEREGYAFAGWNTAFDAVTTDLEIMALYEEVSVNPTFVVDKVYAQPGENNIAVTVTVKNNPGIAAIALDIMYDKSDLTLTGFTYNTAALEGASATPFSATAYQPCLYMVNGTKNIEGDFLFATMYFNVSANASGTLPISLVYDEDNVYNLAEDNVYFDVSNGFISIAR